MDDLLDEFGSLFFASEYILGGKLINVPNINNNYRQYININDLIFMQVQKQLLIPCRFLLILLAKGQMLPKSKSK